MPRTDPVELRLRALLLARGALSGPELARGLGVSQPTLSRLLAAHRDSVLVMGRARATRYAWRRELPSLRTPLPIYEVDPEGGTRTTGVLHPVGALGYYVESRCNELSSGLFGDIPFFLDGLRPSGFLGRLVPRRHPDLGFDADVRRWNGDQALIYAARYGWDLPGAWIVGEQALAAHLTSEGVPAPIAGSDRPRAYEAISDDLLGHAQPGSSAAGEQPKFLALKSPRRTAVMVKFSPPYHDRDTEGAARRVADLLLCEHLALEVLRGHGVPAARSELVRGRRRLFLEVERFDRTARGRRGVMTLEALDAEYIGSGARGQFPELVGELIRQRVVPEEVDEVVRLQSAFRELIADTDMHPGNLGFFARGARVTGLTPAFDVLPMAYMPIAGHVLRTEPVRPRPRPVLFAVWARASDAARAFWERVASDRRVSKPFAAEARVNVQRVAEARKMAERLPE